MKFNSKWKNIETAPTNGSIVAVANPNMDHEMAAAYVDCISPFTGQQRQEWILVADFKEKFLPLRPGSLIWPTHWRALTVGESKITSAKMMWAGEPSKQLI